jgi:Ca-activated chloride channel family protein
LYEIIPVGVKSDFIKDVDELKYQEHKIDPQASGKDELLTVKFRYKDPDGNKSKLITQTVSDKGKPIAATSDNYRWAAAVASFGMILRESAFKGDADFDTVLELANNARGADREGYRGEFIKLVQSSRYLASR